MIRVLKIITIVAVVLIVGIQFVRPARTNPAVDESQTIFARTQITPEVSAILNRSCNDCHSNKTVWPWYTHIAPVSWLMAYGVTAGRKAVNFSEWAAYSPEQQRILLALSCQDVSEGKMPGPYTLLHLTGGLPT